MMRSITLFLGSNKHTTENFSELKHPTEGGQLIKRLEENTPIFFVTAVDKENSKTNKIYKLLQQDLGSSFIPVIMDKWNGFGPAFNAIIKQIERLPQNSLVFKIDSLDVVVAKNPTAGLINAFQSFDADIVLSGEKGLRTRRNWSVDAKSTKLPTQANGGFYGGHKEALLDFLYSVRKYASPPQFAVSASSPKWDDQDAIQQYLLAGTPGFNGKWVVDTKSELAHTGSFEDSSTFDFLPNSKVWHNKHHRMLTPFFYHGCGSSPNRGFFDAVQHVRKNSPLGNCDNII